MNNFSCQRFRNKKGSSYVNACKPVATKDTLFNEASKQMQTCDEDIIEVSITKGKKNENMCARIHGSFSCFLISNS